MPPANPEHRLQDIPFRPEEGFVGGRVRRLSLFIRMAQVHAPKGGVSIGGKQFKGGEFIPGEVLEKATKEEKAAIKIGTAKVPEKATPKERAAMAGKAFFEIAEPTDEIDPDLIEPVNKVINRDKFDELVRRFRDKPWSGPPILALDLGESFKAITGSHRIFAAREAGIDLPIFVIDTDELELPEGSFSPLGDDFFDVDDDGKLTLIKEAMDLNPDDEGLQMAFRIMDFEVDQNE